MRKLKRLHWNNATSEVLYIFTQFFRILSFVDLFEGFFPLLPEEFFSYCSLFLSSPYHPTTQFESYWYFFALETIFPHAYKFHSWIPCIVSHFAMKTETFSISIRLRLNFFCLNSYFPGIVMHELSLSIIWSYTHTHKYLTYTIKRLKPKITITTTIKREKRFHLVRKLFVWRGNWIYYKWFGIGNKFARGIENWAGIIKFAILLFFIRVSFPSIDDSLSLSIFQ